MKQSDYELVKQYSKTMNEWRNTTEELAKGVDLQKLPYVDLSDSDLSNMNLSNAWLAYSNLSNCKLVRTSLKGATLTHANLSNVDFRDVDLENTDFSFAILDGITVNWRYHNLVGELLHQAAVDSISNRRQKIQFAHCILGNSWSGWLTNTPEDVREWALREMATWVKDGDNAPQIVLDYVGKG